jgi:hypothetical protein
MVTNRWSKQKQSIISSLNRQQQLYRCHYPTTLQPLLGGAAAATSVMMLAPPCCLCVWP